MRGADLCLLVAAYFSAYAIRFDGDIPATELATFRSTILPMFACKFLVFWYFNLYRGMWRYTGLVDLLNVLKASVVSSLIILTTILITHQFQGFSRAVFILDGIFTFLFLAGFRVAIRLYFAHTPMQFLANDFFASRKFAADHKNILIVGAGGAGEKILREFAENARLKYTVVGFLDDDPSKIGKYIHGTPVLGSVDDVSAIALQKSISEIVIAISYAPASNMRRIIDLCKDTGVTFKTVPGMGELIDGNVSIKTIRDVSFADLLGRPPVMLEKGTIQEYLTGKTVLVTGAAGSIGSELCRQIAAFSPRRLVLLDRSESPLYELEIELEQNFPALEFIAVLGAVQNESHLEMVFEGYNPDVVFHAAAYKHVPMMELNPWEAIYNNVIGTRNLLKMCQKSDGSVARFVMISTDKAVRPTNVMGASKRLAEILTQHSSAIAPQCKQMAVRFGNVLGSSGSVIPLFMRQIEKGRPITVTDPEVTRYFMTIPEASQLVLQAGAMGTGGEVFVLDMGTPVKIIDMARDLIRLSGLEPDVDIEIRVVGLRPGEKLYEELITEGEGITSTMHEKIMVLRNSSLEEDSAQEQWFNLNEHIDQLVTLAENQDAEGIRAKLKELMPEYMPETKNALTTTMTS